MIPIHLRLRNFFSHKDSEIDFTQFDSAVLVGNVNGDYDISCGSGKSSIFQGLLWCLFNKSRAHAMNDIVMWGENECLVELIFKQNEEIYRIRRLRVRSTSSSEVDFSYQDGDDWVDLSGSTSKLTNIEIIKKIKFDYKTFVNSVYFQQNDISEFAESDARRRKDILKSIIDLSKWDGYENKAKEKFRKLKIEKETFQSMIDDCDQLEGEIIDNEAFLEKANDKALYSEKANKDIEIRLAKYSKEYAKLKNNLDVNQWDRIQDDLSKLLRLLEANYKKTALIQKTLKNENLALKRLKTDIDKIERECQKIIIINNAEVFFEDNKKLQNQFNAEVSSAKYMLKELSSKEIKEGSCHTCGREISKELFENIKAEYDASIEVYRDKVVFAKNKLLEIDEKQKPLWRSIKEEKRLERLKAQVSHLIRELNGRKERVNLSCQDAKFLCDEKEKLEIEIESGGKIIESLKDENFQLLKKKIVELKQRQKNHISASQRANRDIGIYTEKISNLKAKLDRSLKIAKQIEEKEEDLITLGKIRAVLGRKGIQTILLNAVIRDLEITSNKIIKSICDESFDIIIETQRVSSDGVSVVETLDLRVKKDGIVYHFKSLSGGEKFRVSLSLRIALSEISSRHGGSDLEFLLLDEINSPLDKHGTETLFVNVIKALEEKYKILVITHDDILRNRFDNVIDVSKVDGESSVNFVVR